MNARMRYGVIGCTMLATAALGCRKAKVPAEAPVVVQNFVLSVTPVTGTFANAANNTWTSAAPLPAPRAHNATVAAGGVVYVIGGRDASGAATATTYAFDPASNQWSTRAALPHPRVNATAAATRQGDVYLFGGTDDTGANARTILRYAAAADRWEDAGELPIAGGCGGAAAVSDTFYVFVGCDADRKVARHWFRYLPDRRQVDSLTPPAGEHADGALLAVRGELLLMGGHDATGGATATVERYLVEKGVWEPARPLSSARDGLGASLVNQSIFVAGGKGGTGQQVEYADPVREGWVRRAPLPAERAYASVAGIGRLVVVAGGEDRAGTAQASVAVFVHGDYWLRAPSVPSARDAAVSATLDGKIYVIGGFLARTGLVTTNEAFDIATSTWETRAPLPAARGHAMAAVANGRLYVFGGNAPGEDPAPTATVYAYDPQANAWEPKAAMPTATNGGAAVTIDGMIYVSMGDDSRTVFVYDPAKDSWRTLPKAPAGTRAAVGTGVGGKLYLAGGNGWLRFAQDKVSVYDPGSGSWSRGPALPTATRFAGAGSTSAAVYVFGGIHNLKSALSLTQRLDVAAGTWHEVASMPAAAYSTSAVEAGGAFYVIGGKNAADRVTSAVYAYIP
ncbi:MAG: kelch repeat-containing protein [Gemmatimonadaceae bacterium]